MIIIQANGAEGDLEEKILALLRREDIAAERVSLSSRHTLTFPELTDDPSRRFKTEPRWH